MLSILSTTALFWKVSIQAVTTQERDDQEDARKHPIKDGQRPPPAGVWDTDW